MTAAHSAHPDRIPVGQLIHDHKRVFGLVELGHRVEITNRGKVIAIITAPDPDEVALDELAAAGAVPADWRDRQAALRRTLATLPVRTAAPGPPIGSAGIIADRETDHR
jgi:antitoxin (DNA-binding transcriptional repressor) of toxin-antitoxin stability system